MLAQTYECLGHIEKAAVLWRHVAAMDSMYPSYDLPIEEAREELKKHGLMTND